VFVLTGGIVPIITGIITLIKKWDSVVETFQNGCSAVGQFFTDLWDGIVSVWNTVTTWFDTKVIQPVVKFFSGLWVSVSGFFVNLWADIVAIFTAIPGWFDTNVIQPVVNFFVGLWTGISTAASDCWNAIVTFFSPAINWFSQLFSSIWQTISDIFYNIGVIASGCWQIIKAVWGIVSAWFDTNVIQPVVNFFVQLWSTISTAAINAWNGIKNAAIGAWNGIKAVFSTIRSWISTNIIQPVSTFFTNLWNGIKTAAVSAWNGIKSVYATVTTWISTNIIQPVGNFFSNLWTGFINGAKNAWAGVKSVFGSVVYFFQTTFQNAWAGIVKVFSTAGEIFTNIKDAILTAFKSVVNGIIRGLNNVIAAPFNGINTALNKIKNINILGLTPFSSLKSISVPVIPQLAQGGVVDAGQLFVAREAGAELVGNVGRKTAVMNNEQIVESVSQGVYQAVVAAMRANSGNEGSAQSVNVYLDGKQVWSSVRKHQHESGANIMGNQVYAY
jgi:phage-related protein